MHQLVLESRTDRGTNGGKSVLKHSTEHLPLGDENLDVVAGGAGPCVHCGVLPADFPCAGKCCAREAGGVRGGFRAICRHLSLWSSMPEGASLSTAHIFECPRLGYSRRVKE